MDRLAIIYPMWFAMFCFYLSWYAIHELSMYYKNHWIDTAGVLILVICLLVFYIALLLPYIN